ncbi:glycoside hydrolase family 57 protein [Chryseolinea sp. H1M3-3]|uniref:glycoside hydrolase family 57 protein n=1 Tax=Chryseolinea sp. H1M3-3 TaxID=3034144 RepID=UPI0023ED1F13|nr:glycoside hydrolase family 57 protein [Chryseolinea sp. H1M3-3]
MPSICFYFQVHQPFRLRSYDCFKIGYEHNYQDDLKNREIFDRVSTRCYIPANNVMLKLIEQHQGKFKIAYSISGTALEQMENYRPDVLQSFQALAKTGCVEFLSETYHHSLSFLYSKEEFIRQIGRHKEKIEQVFQQSPTIFRNTELIYNNEIANLVTELGYSGILCEGLERILGTKSPNFPCHPPKNANIKTLLRNRKLSQNIVLGFATNEWAEYRLTPMNFTRSIQQTRLPGETINLFMNYEIFSEHRWPTAGILNFMAQLPGEIFEHSDFDFKTPSEVVACNDAQEQYDAHYLNSWADDEHDLSAWLGNTLQQDAIERVYSLEKLVKETGNEELIDNWARLLSSDHFHYMCTKHWKDGDVHKYFSQYNTPYDAYINYMNIVTDLEYVLEAHCEAVTGE